MNDLSRREPPRAVSVETPAKRVAPVVAVSAVMAFILVVIGLTLVALRSGPSAGAGRIDVDLIDGLYEIRVVDFGEDTSQIDSKLEALGLGITFDFVPVPPDRERHLVGVEPFESQIAPMLDADTAEFILLRVPQGWEGQALIRLGRRALSGEPYFSGSWPP